MIRLIEAKNYRSLKYISQPLGDFHVLVGANATGKTTFLDVVSFIADLVGNGVDYAIGQRTQNYMDLTFGGKGGDIELAIELEVPEELRKDNFDRIRYEVKVGILQDSQEHGIIGEKVILIVEQDNAANNSVFNSRVSSNSSYLVISKVSSGNDHYAIEIKGKRWPTSYKLGLKKSALGNMPPDESKYPISIWLKDLLTDGIQLFILDSQNIRQASPPGKGIKFKTDGSNLPWVIEDLKKRDMEAYRNWVEHVRTALPDIQDIITIERQDDRHRYLKIIYDNGMEVPSWMVSDGTLRLLALTLPAYLRDFEGVFLIEEPENGIHPQAIETVFQSLSSVYNAQILLATHSPVILSMVEPKDVLCFSKTTDGVTEIVNGNAHPMLKDWHGTPNLSVLFASGILS
ncbi:MAG: ATP-binding protein [Saprospiraceae bacterium]|nr:ATP-binding protein [Saprospiraceae bacterium]